MHFKRPKRARWGKGRRQGRPHGAKAHGTCSGFVPPFDTPRYLLKEVRRIYVACASSGRGGLGFNIGPQLIDLKFGGVQGGCAMLLSTHAAAYLLVIALFSVCLLLVSSLR